ncbi:hypothetical protein HDU99_000497 [Rhizoclosmatium hyalinum]|nr:hypothetical protein HDU99_000497 [Rhizoclosmatium hyalinum]
MMATLSEAIPPPPPPPSPSPSPPRIEENPLAIPSRFPYPRFDGGVRYSTLGSSVGGGGAEGQGGSPPPPPPLPIPPLAPPADAFARMHRSKDSSAAANAANLKAEDANVNHQQQPQPLEEASSHSKDKAPVSFNPWITDYNAAGVGVGVGVGARRRVTSHFAALPQVLAANLDGANIGDSDSMLNIGKAYLEGSAGLERHVEWAKVWLQEAASRDSTEAMVLLGQMYLDGTVKKWEVKHNIKRLGRNEQEMRDYDLSIAADWFQRAAQAGDLDGMFQLAKCYEGGFGVPNNPQQAFEWYLLGAIKGYPKAQNVTGWCYSQGYGVEKNKTEACKWYRKAAEAGLVEGQLNLGLAYTYGWSDGLKDRTEAAHWFWAAAVTGNDAKSAFELGQLIEKGNGVQRDEYRAFGWFLCAAEGGVVRGMERVAKYLAEGIGCRKDEYEGAKWYQKAIDAGSVTALVSLGMMYERGDLGEANHEVAFSLYKDAASKGDVKAKFRVAYCQENGLGTPRNPAVAVQTYINLLNARTSEINTHPPPECLYRLGFCFENGKGIPQDYDRAFKFYKDSYLQFVPSYTALGRFFQYGLGNVTKDVDKALQLYEHAATKGEISAIYHAGAIYAQRGQQTPSSQPEKALEYMNLAVSFYRTAASHHYPPAMYKLGALLIADPKTADQISEGVVLVREAASLGDVDALELLSKLYSRGVQVDGNGQLVKTVESRLGGLFGRSSTSAVEGNSGARFSLTSRLGGASTAAGGGSKSATLPTPPDSLAGYEVLPKDPIMSTKLKQEAAVLRKEKENLEASIAKSGKKKVPLADNLIDSLERLKI